MKQALIAALAVILALTLSCNKSADNNPPSTPSDNIEKRGSFDAAEAQSLLITDTQGLPLSNARVLIGYQETPENPWLTTDTNGLVEIPETWIDAQDLTIEATDHVRVTLKDQLPSPLTISLRSKSQFPQLELKGTVAGITTKDKDGFIDFSILLDSLTKNEILNFNINKVISPWTERVAVAGFEFPVPQNLFLPKQKETYLF